MASMGLQVLMEMPVCFSFKKKEFITKKDFGIDNPKSPILRSGNNLML